jgi:hypothetical protein
MSLLRLYHYSLKISSRVGSRKRAFQRELFKENFSKRTFQRELFKENFSKRTFQRELSTKDLFEKNYISINDLD